MEKTVELAETVCQANEVPMGRMPHSIATPWYVLLVVWNSLLFARLANEFRSEAATEVAAGTADSDRAVETGETAERSRY